MSRTECYFLASLASHSSAESMLLNIAGQQKEMFIDPRWRESDVQQKEIINWGWAKAEQNYGTQK